MSWKVVEEVVEHSRSKHGTRVLLLTIAETAHHDGVAFGLPHAPSRGREGRGESLVERSNLSLRQIERSVRNAQDLDELEVRTYRIGSRNLKAYRIVVGRLRDVEADLERLRSRWNVELDRPFSNPAELALPPESRPAILAGRDEGSDPPNCRSLPAKLTESDPDKMAGLTRARTSENSSIDTVPNSSRTSSSEKTDDEVAAEAAAVEEMSLTDELLRAFAEEIGAWPSTRSDWSAWKGQFKKLAEQGVTAEQLRHVCRSYREHFRSFRKVALGAGDVPHAELTPFALTKHWLVITASFEPSYFRLHRWITEKSWRLDADDAAWILANAPLEDEHERTQLQSVLADVRRSHESDEAAFLRWVETEGFALPVDAWVKALKSWKVSSETRAAGGDRRAELRSELAGIRFDLGEEAAA